MTPPKIYTKSGDKGLTSLVEGTRISKAHPQIQAYGTIDELNSQLGMLIALAPSPLACAISVLESIQHTLFNIGSTLASEHFSVDAIGDFTAETEKLEYRIDKMQGSIEPLSSFILPGGSQAIAQAHICRTITRRAEREITLLTQEGATVPKAILIYVNRLSDFFFVFARLLAKHQGIQEVKWSPLPKFEKND